MLPLSFYFELIICAVLASIVIFFWQRGRRDALSTDRGWWLIFSGFCLLFLGSMVDITDHFPALSRFVIIGRTPVQSFIEKVVGFLGGFFLLVLGFVRWLPHIAERRQLESRLREANRELEDQVRQGSQEIQLNRLRSEIAVRRHRQTERLMENMVSGAAVALFATDTEGRVTHTAGRALEALGLDAGTVGRPLARLLPNVTSSLRDTLEHGEVTATQATYRDLVFQLRLAPLDDGDGRREGAVVVATDITELHRAQNLLVKARDEAEAANRAKSAFLATMSHELRTPLNSVIGFAQILEKNRGGRLEESDLRFLARIRDNGLHLLTLINDILDLSKIEAGHLELSIQPTRIDNLLREVTEELRPQVRDGVELTLRVPEGPMLIDSDADRLRQIITNLLSNALKFTHRGEVIVSLTASASRPSSLEVADSGIGIPEDRLEKIFEAFQQVDASTSRHYGGTGLGLSICRSLCQRMGYQLEVESREGEGTTFRVVLDPPAA